MTTDRTRATRRRTPPTRSRSSPRSARVADDTRPSSALLFGVWGAAWLSGTARCG